MKMTKKFKKVYKRYFNGYVHVEKIIIILKMI